MTPQLITDRQAELLQILRKSTAPIGLVDITKQMHVAKSSNNGQAVAYALKCLVSCGMVIKCGRGGHQYQATPDGVASLEAHHVGGCKPPAIQVRAGTTGPYESTWSYQRNYGHPDKLSFGVRC